MAKPKRTTEKPSKKEDSYDKELRKVCGLNEGMQVRDYIGYVIAPDMAETHQRILAQFFDVKVGDSVMLISFKWKSAKHKARAAARTRRLLKKHGFIK